MKVLFDKTGQRTFYEDADLFINMLLTFETNPEFEPILNELKKIDNLD